MKNIGKPCTGKPYARFDEGALMKVGTSPRSSRVRRGVIARNGDNYLNQCSTLPLSLKQKRIVIRCIVYIFLL